MKKYGWSILFLLLSIGTGIRIYFMSQNETMPTRSILFAVGLAITFLIISIQKTGFFKEEKHKEN